MRRVALLPLLLLAGWGAQSSAGAPHVVAAPPPIADSARNVAGTRAEVTQILAPNTDPHEYEVRPRDVKAVDKASLVLRSGGDVDAWLGDAVEAAWARRVVDVG